MIIRIGHMYLEYFSVDNWNSEISINFTSKIEDAKRFSDEDIVIVKPIISNLLMLALEVEIIEYKKGGETNDN